MCQTIKFNNSFIKCWWSIQQYLLCSCFYRHAHQCYFLHGWQRQGWGRRRVECHCIWPFLTNVFFLKLTHTFYLGTSNLHALKELRVDRVQPLVSRWQAKGAAQSQQEVAESGLTPSPIFFPFHCLSLITLPFPITDFFSSLYCLSEAGLKGGSRVFTSKVIS